MAQSFLCDFATEYGGYSRKVRPKYAMLPPHWEVAIGAAAAAAINVGQHTCHVHFSGFIVAPVQPLIPHLLFLQAHIHRAVVGLA